jgi:hypothetical protein
MTLKETVLDKAPLAAAKGSGSLPIETRIWARSVRVQRTAMISTWNQGSNAKEFIVPRDIRRVEASK